MRLDTDMWKTPGIGTLCVYVLTVQICTILITFAFIDFNECVPAPTVISLFLSIQIVNTVFDVGVYAFLVSILPGLAMDCP